MRVPIRMAIGTGHENITFEKNDTYERGEPGITSVPREGPMIVW